MRRWRDYCRRAVSCKKAFVTDLSRDLIDVHSDVLNFVVELYYNAVDCLVLLAVYHTYMRRIIDGDLAFMSKFVQFWLGSVHHHERRRVIFPTRARSFIDGDNFREFSR